MSYRFSKFICSIYFWLDNEKSASAKKMHGARLIREHHAARKQHPPPPKIEHSTQYITDDMLAPYFPSSLPTSQVELTISCKALLSTHSIWNKSDPFCVVSMKRPWQDKFKQIARTETIENTHNPEWIKKIVLDYNFVRIKHVFSSRTFLIVGNKSISLFR